MSRIVLRRVLPRARLLPRIAVPRASISAVYSPQSQLETENGAPQRVSARMYTTEGLNATIIGLQCVDDALIGTEMEGVIVL